jgi:hypothetical protein
MKSTMIEQLRTLEHHINSMYSVEEFVTNTQDRAALTSTMAHQIVHILTAPFFKEFIDDTLLSELQIVALSVAAFAKGQHLSYCYITIAHKTK